MIGTIIQFINIALFWYGMFLIIFNKENKKRGIKCVIISLIVFIILGVYLFFYSLNNGTAIQAL